MATPTQYPAPQERDRVLLRLREDYEQAVLDLFDEDQETKEVRPDLKVVHTSGYPRGAMVHQEDPRFREGFIIMKPYRREYLQNIIREALERQQ
jgi:hypothetical protein